MYNFYKICNMIENIIKSCSLNFFILNVSFLTISFFGTWFYLLHSFIYLFSKPSIYLFKNFSNLFITTD